LNIITIGRSAQCDIVLENESVSRFHARIEQTADDQPMVVDDNSHNGTWLYRDGGWIRIHTAWLDKQDRIRFGEVELDRNMILGKLRKASPRQDKKHQTDEPVIVRPKRNPSTGDIEENRD
jgi:pSer/pThr/pTyr-binding forkhead associated (FHA) protein